MTKDKRLLMALTVLIVAILGVALVSLRGDEESPSDTQPEGQQGLAPKENVNSDSGTFGFGQVLTTPPQSVRVDDKPTVPRSIRLYPILPAPFEYFSVEAVQSIAQKLGFSEAAEATQRSGLYIYREGDKTLTINPEAGTINFSSQQLTPNNQQPTPDLNTARTTIKTLMSTLNLDLPIVNWTGAEFSCTDEACLVSTLVPTLEVAGLSLIPPIDYYARFDSNSDLVGLSFWLPNLDYENVATVEVISPDVAIAKVRAGEAIVVRGDPSTSNILTSNNLSLSYLVRPETIYNLGTPQTLLPIYVLENDEVTLYVNAQL